MYAVVKTGGKQYRVSKNDTILVERIVAEEGTCQPSNWVIERSHHHHHHTS